MSPPSILQEGRAGRREELRRARRRRRLHALLFGLLGVVLLLAALLAVLPGRTAGSRSTLVRVRPRRVLVRRVRPPVRPTYGSAPAPPGEQVHLRAVFHVTSAILFDVWTGRVLWAQHPGLRLPIASLTKMMTALIVAARGRPGDPVLITPQAVHFTGSGVGLLPLGKHVPLISLLYGLLLPSGNDAAIALAQHIAGSEERFVADMNAEAHTMRLGCTHFASESGIVDRDNYSCTTDLAVLAHAVLEQPMLAPIVASRSAIIPFPIKGGKLYLYNNNPLLLADYPGTDGVKTGFTDAAGPCLVASARRGKLWLGVVLLHSINPAAQAEKLLDAGFARLATH
jgi:D-alanyl-D-alanine carboxypeptidase (penicillin-binding protein 5/6)